MDTSNLELNKPYKYKELCTILSIEQKKNTNSKNAQLKELQQYLNITKNNTYYTISEIYSKPIMNNGKIEYIKTIELLILDLLVQDKNNGKVFLSKNKLLESLAMINENYPYCKERIPKLSEFMGIQKQTVEEWYESTSNMLKRNLEKALDGLRSQSLIIWSSELTVCELIPIGINKDEQNLNIDKDISKDEYGEQTIEYRIANSIGCIHRETTETEKKFILRTEKETMQELGFTDKQQIIQKGQWSEFKDKVSAIVLDKLKIAYYYNSYKIICNEDHILKRWKEMINLLLSNDDREQHLKLLNGNISQKLHINIENKQKRAIKKNDEIIGECKDDKITRRIQETYIEDNDKLIETLINKDSKNINNKVRKIKLPDTNE